FAAVAPHLERGLALSRQLADFFPGYEHVADPLIGYEDLVDPNIDFRDYGMTAAGLRDLFDGLRAQLVPLARAIISHPPADDSCLRQGFPEAQQVACGLEVARRVGYDFERGRQDKSPHPFCVRISAGDVRITHRVKEGHLSEALFSTLH